MNWLIILCYNLTSGVIGKVLFILEYQLKKSLLSLPSTTVTNLFWKMYVCVCVRLRHNKRFQGIIFVLKVFCGPIITSPDFLLHKCYYYKYYEPCNLFFFPVMSTTMCVLLSISVYLTVSLTITFSFTPFQLLLSSLFFSSVSVFPLSITWVAFTPVSSGREFGRCCLHRHKFINSFICQPLFPLQKKLTGWPTTIWKLKSIHNIHAN